VGGRAGRKTKQGRGGYSNFSAHPVIQSVIKNAYEDVYTSKWQSEPTMPHPPMMRD
jgi:hypothetical protein